MLYIRFWTSAKYLTLRVEAIFVFIDLSSILEENSYDGEQKLQKKLFDELKVLFTPGKDCRSLSRLVPCVHSCGFKAESR